MNAAPSDLLLAAGASRRFGARKLLAHCAGRTLLARAAAAGRDAGLTTIAVFGEFDGALLDAATSARLAFTINAHWRRGQGASVAAGVRALPGDAPAVLIRAADQALVDGAALRRLVDAWLGSPGSIVAAGYSGTHGVPVIFPRRCFGALARLDGGAGARALIASDDDVVIVDLPEGAVDVDTPADLERAERALLSRARGARSARS